MTRVKKTPLATQVGGQHYKSKAIQPVVYNHANKLGFMEGNIVKYATRHAEKGGRSDVLKIIHYGQLLLELEYPIRDTRRKSKSRRR